MKSQRTGQGNFSNSLKNQIVVLSLQNCKFFAAFFDARSIRKFTISSFRKKNLPKISFAFPQPKKATLSSQFNPEVISLMMIFRRSQVCSLAFLLQFAISSIAIAQDPVRPLPTAHAHNDYAHQLPLLDALAAGFCSVEVDVFLVDQELLVGHTRDELRPDRTLSNLYLEPLKQIVSNNAGHVFPADPKQLLWLHIDVKSESKPSYAAIHEQLQAYSQLLTRIVKGKKHEGPIRVLISGNRDFDQIANAEPLLAGIDGRMKDLGSDYPTDVLPLLSDAWRNHFQWDGKGDFSEEERHKLTDLVKKAHQEGRKVRFWATPETSELWAELQNANVDFINTDNLVGLKKFLESENLSTRK